MRADEALLLLVARVRLMRRAAPAGAAQSRGSEPMQSAWQRHADGSMTRRITSMDDLRTFLGGGGGQQL